MEPPPLAPSPTPAASPAVRSPLPEPPFRVGIDLVQVSRIEESIARFGDRFLRRLFTPGEIADCQAAPALATERFAARFAAKEAAIKVLRPLTRWIDPHGIEVRRLSGGPAALHLGGEAAELAQAAGLGGFALSMSHEGDYATAVVIAARQGKAET
jgi:holo-[acyl-carrier protein] synthase